MKKIENINELTEGQEVYIKAVIKNIENSYPVNLVFNDRGCFISIYNNLQWYEKNKKSKLEIFTDEPVGNSEQLNDEEFLNKIDDILHDWQEDHSFSSYETLKSNLLSLCKSYKNSKQLVLPEIGKEYEFSTNGANWYKGEYEGFKVKHTGIPAKHIRPIQQTQEELKAIELLKSLGYTKIEK